jgi:hypothetical protein
MSRVVNERTITIKVPASLDEGLNRYAARLEAASPGLAPSKSDVVRTLLVQALARAESAEAH